MQVGDASLHKHYEKLLKDYDSLPPEMQAEVDLMGEEFKYKDFVPHAAVSLVWGTFHAIRQTKAHEAPITYTDIFHYSKLLRIVFEVWEVKAIIQLDRAYYASYARHHKDT